MSIPVGLLLSSFSGIYVAYKAENLLDAHISRELYLIRYFSSRIPSENVKKDFENCLIYQAKPTSCLTEYVEKTNITEGKKKMFVDYANMEASNKIFSAFNLGDSILFYLFLFLSTICFIATCFLSREYRRGAVHLFVFLFTIEVLYFLPKVGTWLEEFSDLILLSSS